MKDNQITATDILLSNGFDGMPILPDQGPGNEPNRLYLANDTTRFDQAYFSEPLTAYAAGWTDADRIDQLLAFIAPDVPTPRRFEYSEWPNPEVFKSESDDVRQIGSDFKRVSYGLSKVQAKTYNKGLTIRVDLDEVADIPDWKERFTGYLIKRILRNDARRAFTLLAAAASNTAKTWSDGSTNKDPDSDVIAAIDAFGDVMGLPANRVLFGYTAWRYRLLGYGIQATAAGFGGRALTSPEQLATFYGVNQVYISTERYTSSATAKGKITTANLVVIFRGEDGMMKDDPSSFKRFVTLVGGQKYRVFEAMVPPGKFVDLTVEHYSDIVQTGKFTSGGSTYDGIQKLTIS